MLGILDYDRFGHYGWGMAQHPVEKILTLWPSRSAVLDDARAAAADLDLFAVHRWFQRRAVPSRYWVALLDGAQKRGIAVSAQDFAAAHSPASEDAA
jgi:hypothetical protein